MPVSVFRTVTVAPITTAPEASRTLPTMLPEATCALLGIAGMKTSDAIPARTQAYLSPLTK
jgi:hypothetical protein